jgi:hypothetical protein
MDLALERAARIGDLDRRVCRETFERRFSSERMATDYVALYQRLLGARGRTTPHFVARVVAA